MACLLFDGTPLTPLTEAQETFLSSLGGIQDPARWLGSSSIRFPFYTLDSFDLKTGDFCQVWGILFLLCLDNLLFFVLHS